jgi:hypothetical protein
MAPSISASLRQWRENCLSASDVVVNLALLQHQATMATSSLP